MAIERSKNVEYEPSNMEQIGVQTGVINAGDTDVRGSVNIPVDPRDDEVFRIWGAQTFLPAYGAGNTVANGRCIMASEGNIEEHANDVANNLHNIPKEELLYTLEVNVDVVNDTTNGVGYALHELMEYVAPQNPGFIDYPLGEIEWMATNPSSNTQHIFADVVFMGEVVEVDEDYNLDLLRTHLNKYL